jgi:hypothetical protein
MKKTIAILSLLFLFGQFAQAQFRKPLTSASSRVNSTEALYNIGLSGGLTSTYWLHFGGTETQYKQPFNFGILGGLSLERMLNGSNSISLEGYYAMRKVQLNYDVLNIPTSIDESNDYYRQFNADFQEVDVQAIFTHYFSKSTIRPYVFIGPRVSIPLAGKMYWQKKEIEGYGTPEQHYIEESATFDTVEMSAQNTRQFNVGLVAGVGVLYKLNVGNYYMILKADVSGHAAAIYSFSHEEITGESQNVIGAGYIDPYLLGMRFNTDVTAKITLMFPLKKQLQGACMKWGEYD